MADDDFSGPSVDPRPEPGHPPADWKGDSWLDYATFTWWLRDGSTWRKDPPPIELLGMANGVYWFVSRGGEVRDFTVGQLFGRGGLVDLFTGDLRWPTRHYPARDRDGNLTGRPNAAICMEALVAACDHAGYYGGSRPFRSVGTWPGQDGRPIVHTGDRVLDSGGMIHPPGSELDGARYVKGDKLEAPAHESDGRFGTFRLKPDRQAWRTFAAHLDEWNFSTPEGRELYLGKVFVDNYGAAAQKKPHVFVRASHGSGKSTLLRWTGAAEGGAAHPVQRTYSKAYLEQRFSHTACALLLDESESDTEAQRIKKIQELSLSLYDDGVSGGRGSAGGQARQIDLHGGLIMVATLVDDLRGTVRSRFAMLELNALGDRPGHDMVTPERMQAMIAEAETLSAAARAYALEQWPRFNLNLKQIRAKILELGGTPRDADTLGTLLAGWATAVFDQEIDDDELGRLERFKPFIVSVAEADQGEDDPGDLFNTLLGLPMQMYRDGDQLSVGMVIARAREDSGPEFRRALLLVGLRLMRQGNETWEQAWLAVATKHAGLDRLFSDYPQYRGIRRSQILADLVRGPHQVKHAGAPIRFAGPQSQAWLVPPELLPSIDQESG
jgi:hypothetical protein